MKLHCHRPSLSAAFSAVGGAVPSRSPRDILKNVKLTAHHHHGVVIEATDSETAIRYTLPDHDDTKFAENGEVLLPWNRVNSILREHDNATVLIENRKPKVRIAIGSSEFTLSSEDPSEFPPVADFDEEAYFAIPGDVLREAIRRTLFATDVESARYALGGVLVEPGEHGLTLAATDSRRLAVVDVACTKQGDPGSGPANGAVIPSKAMSLIEKSLAGVEDDDVWVVLRGNDVLVKSGNGTIVSRLVEGRFPKYRQVIPAESPVVIDMVAGPFHTAVRQAQIVTSDESRGVDFTFSDGNLTLQSQAADVGASKIEMPIPYSGDELTITFDPKYVAEFLRVIDPETAFTLHLTDGGSQAVARVGSVYTYVIMPLSREA